MKENPLAGFSFAGISPSPLPKAVQDIMAKLDAAPAMRLFTTIELAASVGRSACTLRQHMAHHSLSEYRHVVRGRLLYWGSKATIKELKRRMNDHRRSDS